jgi:hypothetical protein
MAHQGHRATAYVRFSVLSQFALSRRVGQSKATRASADVRSVPSSADGKNLEAVWYRLKRDGMGGQQSPWKTFISRIHRIGGLGAISAV